MSKFNNVERKFTTSETVAKGYMVGLDTDGTIYSKWKQKVHPPASFNISKFYNVSYFFKAPNGNVIRFFINEEAGSPETLYYNVYQLNLATKSYTEVVSNTSTGLTMLADGQYGDNRKGFQTSSNTGVFVISLSQSLNPHNIVTVGWDNAGNLTSVNQYQMPKSYSNWTLLDTPNKNILCFTSPGTYSSSAIHVATVRLNANFIGVYTYYTQEMGLSTPPVAGYGYSTGSLTPIDSSRILVAVPHNYLFLIITYNGSTFNKTTETAIGTYDINNQHYINRPSENRFLAFYHKTTPSNHWGAVFVNYGGSSLSITDTSFNFATMWSTILSCIPIDSNTYWVFYLSYAVSDVYHCILTVNGNTITKQKDTVLTVYPFTSVVFSGNDFNVAPDTYAFFDTQSSHTSGTPRAIKGYVAEFKKANLGVATDSTGNVTLKGVLDMDIPLIAGVNYYIDNLGVPSTSSLNGRLLGKAISPTEILVDDFVSKKMK